MDSTPKIKVFKDIENLKQLLSKNEIGGFRPWRYDGYKWISFSDYFNFGTPRKGSNLQNNLAYYISSDDEHFAQEIKLVLNITNPEESKDALGNFIRIALKTFSVLDLTPPQNMLTSLTDSVEFEHEDENYLWGLKILKSNVDSRSLTIRSK